ncbi:DNA polymerase III subunit beta [Segniliparus rugosus]|uniref:Beta sliding clamp n=1 Tax=Segniliparus rugosus (strain ATCC BAA-974 / DSM 45345 / CCUG 50838 / CIP 108380 / JCM 13579 / CDC 945) TaxID=679197 RepID=E5XV96_SEGRC|nr:DNA polymerase III subunit beta [Segniliparus rugosus]EFV11709.1 DNA polymerase III, beta subunit [Segniliparus rugosus ATCC BAA-974]
MSDEDFTFEVPRDLFADSVSWVTRRLPARPAMPLLAGLLLSADETGELSLGGTDYDLTAQAHLSAQVSGPGRVLVSGRLLADIAKALPSPSVKIVAEGSKVHVRSGSAKFTLPTMPVDEFPSLAEHPAPIGVAAAKELFAAISQVGVAASRDDTLPALTGLRLVFTGQELELAATDRFRLSVRKLAWEGKDFADEPVTALVPAAVLSEFARTPLPSDDTPVEFALDLGSGSPSLLGVQAGPFRITTRLLDAQLPDVSQLIPKRYTAVARVDLAPLVEAVRRVSLVSARRSQIRLDFESSGEDSVLRLSAGGEEAGFAEEELPVRHWGESISVVFNPGYLLDGLSTFRAEQAQFGFTGQNRAVALVSGDGAEPEAIAEGYTAGSSDQVYVLMPVRLQG